METRVTTDITTEPVTLGIMRYFLKFADTDTNEDALITAMIKSARQLLEKSLNMSFAEKTIKVLFSKDDFVGGFAFMPYPPFISIDTVKYILKDGTKTELTENDGYFLCGLNTKELTVSYIDSGTIEVVYNTGYGGDTETLPAVFTELIKKQVAEWFNNREDYYAGTMSSEISEICQTFKTWL